MDWWALDGPCKTKETNRKAGSGVEQEPQAGLVLCTLVLRFVTTLFLVAPDGRNEQCPCDDISDTNGKECETDLESLEVPLIVDQCERLDEHKNQSVGETREKRQDEDNGLGKEHLEGTNPGDHDLFGGEAVLEGDELVRTPDIRVGVGLAP